MNAETSVKAPASKRPHEIDPATTFWDQPELVAQYRKLVLEELGPDTIEIGCVVSRPYVFDFLILYESLLESWTFYSFRLHVFAADRESHELLSGLGLEDVEVHLLPTETSAWKRIAIQKVKLVEESGLDRCMVADADNVFVAETPELFMLLDQNDFVFIGSPAPAWPIQTSLWAFRKNDRSVEFSRRWYERSLPLHGDASGLPSALLHDRPDGLSVKVLSRPKPESNPSFVPSPYDVQADMKPFSLSADSLGFREEQMGRAKVIHLGGLNAAGRESLASRIDVVCERFPEAAPFLPLYVTLATRAAERLGIATLPDPLAYLRERLGGGG